MLMHPNIEKNQWNDVQTEIKKTWNKLDSAELEATNGDLHAISSLVQKRYGYNAAQAEEKLDDVCERCGIAAGPATFAKTSGGNSSSSRNASSAGPADVGSNVDPSSLSASINQTRSTPSSSSNSSGASFSKSSSSFHAPEEGWDSIDEIEAEKTDAPQRLQGADAHMDTASSHNFDQHRDSRLAEDVTTNEPKRFSGSEGKTNDSRSDDRQARDSGRSQTSEKSAGDSGRSENFDKQARNSKESTFSQSARNGNSESAPSSRSSEDSSQEE